ncbi:hypothetical protein JZO66_15405 [Enterococcus sp. DIV0242_7C1]|nr:hypothetical protein [Enterococcus sp. DIV0242_7C1]MBO0471944.1 hypothetical protein [Enterococcus sp. DIV0242_7C1]
MVKAPHMAAEQTKQGMKNPRRAKGAKFRKEKPTSNRLNPYDCLPNTQSR